MPSLGPHFIGVDWGTSSFRAYLSDVDGKALAALQEPQGALSLTVGAHESFLLAKVAPWRDRFGRLPILMSGMVGAQQGWIPAPYVECPANLGDLARAILAIDCPALAPIGVVPGLSYIDADNAPDVMRGEETQLFGALEAGASANGYFVLPGTHSKWACVTQGRIVSFASYMTGDVFAALKGHTILGALMREGRAGDGFERGVAAAMGLRAPGDLLHAIFMTRTLGLFERLAADQLAEFLSGLLIGAELLAGAGAARAATLIGAPELVARYATAGARLGLTLITAPENCALIGQAALLRRWTSRE